MAKQEYLKQVTIGNVSELCGLIELKEYDPAWAALYEAERQKINNALKRNGIIIEHVGSTSVPGLCAKPIIDILLLVEDPSDEDSYVPELEKAGYAMRVREPDWYGHRMLKGTNPEVNLHVFSIGCGEAQRMLDFRDWLRTHEADRNLYADTKRCLVQKRWKYLQDYADAKSGVVREIFKHIVPTYKICQLTELYIPEMQALFHDTIITINSKDYAKEEVEDWASCGNSIEHWKELLAKNDYVGVLDGQDRIIGFSSMNAEGYLHSMFVHKDWQGKGVATLLLTEVEKMARCYSVHKISVEASITARPFFEKHGYKVVKEQQAKAYRLYLRNFVMEKTL